LVRLQSCVLAWDCPKIEGHISSRTDLLLGKTGILAQSTMSSEEICHKVVKAAVKGEREIQEIQGSHDLK
jgi:hypothetical protein